MPYKDKEKERARCKEKYKRTKPYYKKYGLRWRYTVKIRALIHYSSKDYPICANCGESDVRVLCLDHINGGGRKDKILLSNGSGGYNYYSKLEKLDYPDGIQVLCSNCNTIARYDRGEIAVPEDGRVCIKRKVRMKSNARMTGEGEV